MAGGAARPSRDTATPRRLEDPSESKVSEPELRHDIVSRARLVAACRDSGLPVVGVTAPAGYGKTSLLMECGRTDPGRTAWVRVDQDDDDPGALLDLLASSVERLVPALGGVRSRIVGEGPSAFRRGARRLASGLAAERAPWLLLLDDLHELRSPRCHEVLAIVLARIPPGAQVVCASRHAQPYLVGPRAQGDVVDVGARDLALDAHGAQRVLAETHEDVTCAEAARVAARTEGWPAGIRLAAHGTTVAEGTEMPDWSDVSGEDRHVADYFRREVYAQLDAEQQQFLRRTSILEHLHGSLCDAVTGEPTGRDHLRRLEETGSFLVPLDGRRAWYRAHALFREFLQGELHRSEPEAVEELHLRAADWLERDGSPGAAVDHLVATPARRATVERVARLLPEVLGRGETSRVSGWFDGQNPQDIRDAPLLSALAGWVAAWTGRTLDAERWAATVEEMRTVPTVAENDVASFDAVAALLRAARCPQGPEQMLTDAEDAARRVGPWSPWRASALYLTAEAHLLLGATGASGAAYRRAAACGHATRNSDVVALSRAALAHLLMDDGRWAEAAVQSDCALALANEQAPGTAARGVGLLPLAAAARLAVHRADPKQADALLARAMQARLALGQGLPWLAVRGRVQVAKVLWALGDRAGVQQLLREVAEVHASAPDLDLGALESDVTGLRALVTARGDDHTMLRAPALTPAELRLLPYLQTHLRVVDVAQRLNLSRNTVATEIAAIYRKLGVSSRGEAVEAAEKLGLLAE